MWWRITLALSLVLWTSAAGAQAPPTSQCVTSAVAGGTGDAITIARLPCVPTTTLLLLTITYPNTTTSPTLGGPGMPTLPIVAADGTALAVGTLRAGLHAMLSSNGQMWFLLSGTVSVSGFGIPVESCNGVGDGTTDDTNALTQCDTLAVSHKTSLVLTKTYRVARALTLAAPEVFVASGSLKPDSGVAVTVNGPISAPDTAVIFTGAGTVTVPGQPRVSVAWWGAVPGTVDAVPGFQRAVTAGISNKKVVCPPGVYTFDSVQATLPYTIPSGANWASVYITGQSNFELDCEGADIHAGPHIEGQASSVSGGSFGWTFFQIGMNSTDFRVHGFLFSGDYHSTTVINVAFFLWGVQRFTFDHLGFSGNWGYNGNPFVGDWQVDGVFSDIKMAQVGICFDFGFVRHVTLDKIIAIGSDGGTGPGLKCFSLIHDAVNAGANPLPISVPESDGLSITNSDLSNFANGYGYGPVVIATGANLKFNSNRFHHNPGASGALASVMSFLYVASGSFSSVGHPVHAVVISDNLFDDNGATVPLPVIKIESNTITNADLMGAMGITGNGFINNTVTGYTNIGTGTLAGMYAPSYEGSGNYFGGTPAGTEVDFLSISLGLIPGFKQAVTGNSGTYPGGGADWYMWYTPGSTNENVSKALVTFVNGGFVHLLSAFAITPPGAGQSYTLAFRSNGVDTGLTCTFTGTSQNCSSSDGNVVQFPFAAGVDVHVTSTAGAPATTFLWGLEMGSYD